MKEKNEINIEETNCRAPPPKAMWQTREKNKLEKNKKKNTTTCKQSRAKNKGKITGKPKHKTPPR